MTVLDYAMMVEDSHVETRIVEYRSAPGAMAAANSSRSRSPTCSATACPWSIRSSSRTKRRARSAPSWCSTTSPAPGSLGLAYVYLGYWVRGSGKMDYKSRFLPQERLMPEGWARAD